MTRRYVGVGLLLLLSLFGCGEKTEESSDRHAASGETAPLEVRLPGGDWGLPTPFTFYPRGPGYVHLSLVYDTLVWKDRKGTIPWLAESWESAPDGRTWTFHLRSGVKWHDGNPLTARDVRFSVDTLKRHPVEWFSLEKVRAVEVLDDFTVRFHLESPYAPFLTQVAGNVPIFPEHIWREVSDPRETSGLERAVGSGPFRLVHYDKAQGAYAYEANGDFFLGRPRVRRLLFVPASDPIAALQRGDVDEASVPASLLPRLRDDKKFELLSGPAYWVLTLQFNRNRFPFSEQPIRHAVAHAVDRWALIEQSVPGGLEGAKPGNPGFLPPDSSWFDPANQDTFPYDPARARALLQSAGIEDRDGNGIGEGPDGNPMSFTLITTSPHLREAEALQLMMRRMGFALEIKPMDVKTLDALVHDGRFDLALTGRGGLGGDPSFITGFGAGRDSRSWSGTPGDPEYLQAAQRLLVAIDQAERAALCNTMQRLYAHELPALPLIYPLSFAAVRPQKLKGWFFTADGGIGIGVPSPLNKLVFVGENPVEADFVEAKKP